LLEVPYREEVMRYVRQVVKELNPVCVVLYGSVAKGIFGVGSDIEILVVAEGLPESFLERLGVLYELSDGEAPIEAVAYTPEEFSAMLERRHPTALHALEDGIPLHGQEYFMEMKRRLQETKRETGLVRVEGCWIPVKLLEKTLGRRLSL